MHTRTWHLDVHLYEHDDHTRAEAVLRTDVTANDPTGGPATITVD